MIDPPGSDRDEAKWDSEIVSESDCDLLLDLHNLYANALNFNFDPKETFPQAEAPPLAALAIT